MPMTGQFIATTKTAEQTYFSNVFVDNVSHYRVQVADIMNVLPSHMKLFFVVFLKSDLSQLIELRKCID